jgi:hypothetical protein
LIPVPCREIGDRGDAVDRSTPDKERENSTLSSNCLVLGVGIGEPGLRVQGRRRR